MTHEKIGETDPLFMRIARECFDAGLTEAYQAILELERETKDQAVLIFDLEEKIDDLEVEKEGHLRKIARLENHITRMKPFIYPDRSEDL